jgi:hypothetical protein
MNEVVKQSNFEHLKKFCKADHAKKARYEERIENLSGFIQVICALGLINALQHNALQTILKIGYYADDI